MSELLNDVYVRWFSTSVAWYATFLNLKSSSIEITVCTMGGKIERFPVRSKIFPGLHKSDKNSIWNRAWCLVGSTIPVKFKKIMLRPATVRKYGRQSQHDLRYRIRLSVFIGSSLSVRGFMSQVPSNSLRTSSSWSLVIWLSHSTCSPRQRLFQNMTKRDAQSTTKIEYRLFRGES